MPVGYKAEQKYQMHSLYFIIRIQQTTNTRIECMSAFIKHPPTLFENFDQKHVIDTPFFNKLPSVLYMLYMIYSSR